MDKVTFVVGQGFDAHGKALAHVEGTRKEAFRYVASVYGGFTAYQGFGAWVNGAGELVSENSLTLFTYSDAGAETAHSVAERLRQLFGQESVVVSIERAEVAFVAGKAVAA